MGVPRFRARPRGIDAAPAPPAWAAQALCARVGTPADWHPDDSDQEAIQAAVAVCGRCPVRTDCRDFALEHPPTSQVGIWGGLTADERIRERRRQMRARKAA
ncbi:transcription factor WhiB [Nocardiopsis sp. Huas11]|uniref:WhiB family transcriptional regulator n=1 Tax=Nocardiopsis sp. Huas11 TaxID=2183912 RepID=UPI000EB2D2F2|nr:WhiB family transcriptional regulator [Nocardiopsis sp. Huas11]RKS10004.1 transcription factor WhiB [Nocardiopsis sp. Huas11]